MGQRVGEPEARLPHGVLDELLQDVEICTAPCRARSKVDQRGDERAERRASGLHRDASPPVVEHGRSPARTSEDFPLPEFPTTAMKCDRSKRRYSA